MRIQLTMNKQALQQSKSPVREPARKKPGSTGRGDYYHIEVRPAGDFVTFLTQDVGKLGHIQRVAGRRSSGYWATVKWLIGKEDSPLQDNKNFPRPKRVKQVI